MNTDRCSRPTDAVSRRAFLQTATAATAATAATLAAPAIVTADKTGNRVVIGQGECQYTPNHSWAQLPEKFTWQTTHNVAIDSEGLVYVIHEGRKDQPDHPSIFVFDPEGRYVRSFGNEFQGGGHGIEVRRDGTEEFVYVAAYQEVKTFAKLTKKGELVWKQGPPMQSGVYTEDEAELPRAETWGRDRFLPTNFAFLPDGGFYLADGYGSFYMHRFDRDGKWLSCFGGKGKEDGKFETPHGIWLDSRSAGEPSLVVVDRANARLQWFTLDGKHLRTQDGFLLPANTDTRGDLLLIPDLHARVTLLGKENQVVTQLGEDPQWLERVKTEDLRSKPETWENGRFIHPHDACFDAEGNIFVAEWVQTGRITKLSHV